MFDMDIYSIIYMYICMNEKQDELWIYVDIWEVINVLVDWLGVLKV